MNNYPFPKDPYNDKFLKDIFPANWKNPDPAPMYDLVIIGGGPGGMTSAMLASRKGLKVALVEKEHLGGECLSAGCIPSKAFLHASRLSFSLQHAQAIGVQLSSGPDFSKVMEKVRRLRSTISPHDSALHFKELGADIFLGKGVFVGPNELEVKGQRLHFKKALIATGTEPAAPENPGLKEAGFLTNQTIFNLTSLPKRLAILGSGPIGCELAQAFTRFGSEVILITRGEHLLPKEDLEATELLEKVFRNEGVKIHSSCQLKHVELKGSTKRLILDNGATVEVDEILVCIGRKPVVEGYGLDKAGVKYDIKKGIETNDFMESSNPSIYVIPSHQPKYNFTHMSRAIAKAFIHNAFEGKRIGISTLIIPWCTYTDPEIAHVGLYEKDAIEKNIKVRTLKFNLENVERAILQEETNGFVKILIREESDEILGATLVGSHAGEMISELGLSITAKVGAEKLMETIHPFPTQSEVIQKAAETLTAAQLLHK